MVKKGERKLKGFELSIDEREQVKIFLSDLGMKATLEPVLYPISVAKVLFQLGHEPYSPTLSKPFIYFGRDALYLPNVLVYLRNTIREFGLLPIYRGVETSILAIVSSRVAALVTLMYMNRYYPNIGGTPISGKEESQMSSHESFRVMVRQAIRESIAQTVGIILSRPFKVIMVRSIAQLVGGENTYPNVWTSFWRISDEEGLAGLFAGLVPDLIVGYITIWGNAAVSYAAERFMENSFDKEDEEAMKTCSSLRSILPYAIPMVVGTISYPFSVVSTVMAVSGSGLLVSLLPYSPPFAHWTDAYNYMKPNKLSRGSGMFFRKLREC